MRSPLPSPRLCAVLLLLILSSSARAEVVLAWTSGRYSLTDSSSPGTEPKPLCLGADLDRDGAKESVTVSSGRATLRRGARVLWRSAPSWRVTHAAFADSNRDGRLELNLALWKRGSYGPDRPFFVKENDRKRGCHLFLYAWRAKGLRCIWGSSAIDHPIREMAFADLRGDANPDLVVLESPPHSDERAPATHLAVWRWNGWGFTNQFRSPKAHYSRLRIVRQCGRDLAIACRGSDQTRR